MYEDALNYYQSCCILYEKALKNDLSKNQEILVRLYDNIGIINFMLFQFEKSLNFLEKSINLRKNLKNDTITSKFSLAKTNFFAGLAAENLKNYEKATIFLTKYENILTEIEKNY